MNQIRVATPTAMARSFMLAPHLKAGAGAAALQGAKQVKFTLLRESSAERAVMMSPDWAHQASISAARQCTAACTVLAPA